MSGAGDGKPIEHRGKIIRAEIRTSATPERAYEAWANPVKISHWFTDNAEGKAEVGATITWIFEKFNFRIPYEVVRAEAGKEFAVRWEPPPGYSAGVLDVTISREGGETVVRLVNSGFREGAEWNDEYEGVDSGWQMALSMLKLYLEKYYGEPRSAFLAMRPAEYTTEKLLPFHRTGDGLGKWLTTSGAFGEVGEAFRLSLKEGGRISGRVLAWTKSETQLSWDEIRGALGLKAFTMGPQKMIGVHGCGWGLSAERAREIEQQMERALERLAAELGEKERSKEAAK
jgi:uncharacterized protein YndB with AHSA1/START domain